MKRLIYLLILLATSAQAAAPDVDAVVSGVAAEAIAHGPIPGLSVAVLREGSALYARGFGEAELDNHVPATAATVYRINSIAKAMTAVALLQLAERSKLRLDDPLSRYFPEFTRPGHDPTLVQLLNHSGGLLDYGGPAFHKNIHLDLTPRQWVESVNDEHLYTFVPGRDWGYSNVGYDLLGLIVEKVAQTPFPDYLRTQIFAVANMPATRMCNGADVVPNRAFSYKHGDHGWMHAESWGTYGDASGRVCSTVQDLAAFWTALEGGRLVTPASLKAMRERGRLTNGTAFAYGFGTRLGQLDGHPLIAYSGDGESWTSTLAHSPDHRITVVVLTNTESDARSARRIATDILRGVAGMSAPAAQDRKVESTLARELPGTWGSESPGEISVSGGHVLFKPAGVPVEPVALLYLGHGVFRFDSPAPDVEVAFNTRQKPYAVEIFSSGIFQKLFLKQSP